MSVGKVILICGLPGSGKTTLAGELTETLGAVRFSPDEWMTDMKVSLWDSQAREAMEQRLWQLAQTIALQGGTVILENGFWTKSERDRYLQAARKLGLQIELRALFISKDETRRRLEARGMEGDDIILSEKLDEYYEVFEKPTEEELAQYDNSD